MVTTCESEQHSLSRNLDEQDYQLIMPPPWLAWWWKSTLSSVWVITELHEKHKHTNLVIAVLAIRSVNTCVYCMEQNLVLNTKAISTLACSYPNSKPETRIGRACRMRVTFKRFTLVLCLTIFSHLIQHRIMVSEGFDVVPSSAGPPDQNTGPPGHELNTNMGTMTQLLTEVCVHLPTGNMDASPSSQSPHCTGQERRRQLSVSTSSDEGERTIASCMPHVMMLHSYWLNHRTTQMLRARTSCLRNS